MSAWTIEKEDYGQPDQSEGRLPQAVLGIGRRNRLAESNKRGAMFPPEVGAAVAHDR